MHNHHFKPEKKTESSDMTMFVMKIGPVPDLQELPSTIVSGRSIMVSGWSTSVSGVLPWCQDGLPWCQECLLWCQEGLPWC